MNRRTAMGMIVAMLPASIAHSRLWGKSAHGVKARSPRVRPGDSQWPGEEAWERLNQSVGGRLLKVHSPLEECRRTPTSANCALLFDELRNPYYIGDHPGLSQTLGWVDAWTFVPSVYAVAAEKTSDFVAAINFARQRNLRLVVKGGGHSYQGTSSAPDSLLLWTRRMKSITVHDSFVPRGGRSTNPKHAVSVEAGAMWMQVYDAVTTQAGRYVQGGGCTTVGVAGLVQSGGFGSFSKRYGTAAASLLEAEIVTADGRVRIANASENADLFWGIKGGGGGSLGVITRVTLETHELPALFGAVNASIRANSDTAFRRLIGSVLAFYRQNVLNPHWGEQIILKEGRVLNIQMMSQGLGREEASAIWKKFFDGIAESPEDFTFISKPRIIDFPARSLWNPEELAKYPGVTKSDDRPGAPAGNLFWAGDGGQCGQVLHGYDSVWLPAVLLDDSYIQSFADVLYAAAKQWQVSLHVNKGLAGAPQEALDAARNTAMNPAVLGAFALAILGSEEPPAYPGIAGHEPDSAAARDDACAIGRAVAELRKIVPEHASYVSESNFFEKQWQPAFWGEHYPRLLRIKTKYDPQGLFYAHHAVGSEAWSADGFTPLPELAT